VQFRTPVPLILEMNMTLKLWLAAGVLTSLSFGAIAQQAAQTPDPLDANAAVPASTYESAFKNYQDVAENQTSPDKIWRAANDEMARLGGHAGHMESETLPTSDDHNKHH